MDFIQYYQSLNSTRLRQAMREVRDSKVTVNREIIEDALKFFTRENDWEQVRDKNVGRYAMTLVEDESKDPDSFTSEIGRYEPYLALRNKEAVKFYTGIYETICTGIAQTICNTIANLFTSYEQTWRFITSEKNENGEDKESEDTDSIIKIHREQGLFDSRIVECDFLASAVDSALLHIFPKGEWLSYDAVWPSSVRIVFGHTIRERINGPRKGIERPVDYTDIEDASAVILKLGGYDSQVTGDPNESMWLAYVGACEEHKLGRMVQYHGTEYWPIPELGDLDRIITEYDRADKDGETVVCNPLTYIANNTAKGVGGGYEYPLVTIRGDQRFGASDVLPVSTTFYNNCVEIESAWSQILRQGVKCARGKDVIHLATNGDTLPKSLDVVVVPPGATYNYVEGNAAGVAQSIETATSGTRAIAASRGVPPYVVVGTDQGSPESGIALALRTQPLIDSRNRRIKMNRGEVAKIFAIESALLTEIFPDLENTFAGVSQAWDPGRFQMPKDQTTLLADLKSARDMEVIDQVETVRVALGLSTDKEAEDVIAKFAERDPDYRGLEPTEPNTPPAAPSIIDDGADETGDEENPEDVEDQ